MRAAQWANNRGHPDTRASLLASYLSLPGSSGNYASTPDSAANSITGDIDIRIKVAMDDWTPAGIQTFASKYISSLATNFVIFLNTAGTLRYDWSVGGVASGAKTSTAATGVSDGATKWIRVTHDADNDAGGNDVKFWLSDDGGVGTQLGTTVTTAGTITARDDPSTTVKLGTTTGSAFLMAGKIYRVQIYNGIEGTLAVDFDPTLSLRRQTSLRGATGELWTINQSGATPAILTL